VLLVVARSGRSLSPHTRVSPATWRGAILLRCAPLIPDRAAACRRRLLASLVECLPSYNLHSCASRFARRACARLHSWCTVMGRQDGAATTLSHLS